MFVRIMINNEIVTLNEEPNEKLSSILRKLNFISVKNGCGKGRCGSCTVLLNGKPIPSCKVPIGILDETSNIITLEYFKNNNDDYKIISEGLKKANIHLCGFCNAAKILSIYELLCRDYRPKEAELIDFTENLTCTCTEKKSLISGIIYAMAGKHERIGKDTSVHL